MCEQSITPGTGGMINSNKNSLFIQILPALSAYSQENCLSIHPSGHNEPSSKAETACVGKVNHGLGEGVGKTVHVGLFVRVPVQR